MKVYFVCTKSSFDHPPFFYVKLAVVFSHAIKDLNFLSKIINSDTINGILYIDWSDVNILEIKLSSLLPDIDQQDIYDKVFKEIELHYPDYIFVERLKK